MLYIEEREILVLSEVTWGVKGEGQNTPPQGKTRSCWEKRGSRRRLYLQLQTAGDGEVERWQRTPPWASHTSDSNGSLSHTPSRTHTNVHETPAVRQRKSRNISRKFCETGPAGAQCIKHICTPQRRNKKDLHDRTHFIATRQHISIEAALGSVCPHLNVWIGIVGNEQHKLRGSDVLF